jgi:hypothetical protein
MLCRRVLSFRGRQVGALADRHFLHKPVAADAALGLSAANGINQESDDDL